MIFDTDILIWIERRHRSAAQVVDRSEQKFISAQTYLELMQYAENKEYLSKSKAYLKNFGFEILPITENISHRAMVYIEEYGLSHRLGAGDALIAATAVDHNLVLVTGNEKHFRAIKDLKLRVFKP